MLLCGAIRAKGHTNNGKTAKTTAQTKNNGTTNAFISALR
jgi:hypothetical protein